MFDILNNFNKTRINLNRSLQNKTVEKNPKYMYAFFNFLSSSQQNNSSPLDIPVECQHISSVVKFISL